MRFYMVTTTQRGDIIIRARNKQEVMDLCNDENLDVMNISLLATYCNDNYGDDAVILGQ